MKEILFAGLIAFLNLLSGIFVYKLIIQKPNKMFFRLFFGSILFRYAINLFLLWFFLKIMNFEPLIFALSYMVGTFFAIVTEVLYLNKAIKC